MQSFIKILFYSTLLLQSYHSTASANALATKADSLITILDAADNLEDRINATLEIIRYYADGEMNYVASLKYAQSLAQLIPKPNSKKYRELYLKSLQMQSNAYYYLGKLDSCKWITDQWLDVAKHPPTVYEQTTLAYYNILGINTAEGELTDYFTNLEYLSEHASLCGSPSCLMYLYSEMGLANNHYLKNKEEALRYGKLYLKTFLEALDSDESLSGTDSFNLCISYLNLAKYYRPLNLDSAISYLDKAKLYVNHAEATYHKANINLVEMNVANKKGDHATAIVFGEKAQAFAKQLNSQTLLLDINRFLIKNYLEINDTIAAVKLLNYFKEISTEEQASPVTELQLEYLNLQHQYESINDPEKALTTLQQYVALKDSIQQNEFFAKTARSEALAKVQLEQAEERLAQTLLAQRQNFWIILLTGGLVFLILALMIGYRFYQRRTKDLEKIRQLNTQLEKYTKSISHDILAKLRTITLSGKVLLNQKTPSLENYEKQHQLTRNSAQWLINYCTGLLKSSTEEVLGQKIVDLQPLLDDLLETFEPILELYEFSVEVPPTPYTVKAPEPVVTQIFYNLLDNAIKFTSKQTQPKIAIATSVKKSNLLVTIKDNGIGMSKETIQQILRRGNESKKIAEKGLQIVQQDLKSLGSQLIIDQNDWQGTTFEFTLPLEMRKQ